MYKLTKFYVKIRDWFFFLLWAIASGLFIIQMGNIPTDDNVPFRLFGIMFAIAIGGLFWWFSLIDPKILVKAKGNTLCLLNAEGKLVGNSEKYLFRPQEDKNYNYFAILEKPGKSTSTKHLISVDCFIPSKTKTTLKFALNYNVKYNSCMFIHEYWELFCNEWKNSPKRRPKKSSIPKYSVDTYIKNLILKAKDIWAKESTITNAKSDTERVNLINEWLEKTIVPTIKQLSMIDACEIKAMSEQDINIESFFL